MLKRGEVKAGPGVRSGRITRAKILERWRWERRILKKPNNKNCESKERMQRDPETERTERRLTSKVEH